MSALSVTTIQTPLYWEDKPANLQMLEEKVNAIEGKTEIVILPEMFSTGFSMRPEVLSEKMDGTTIEWMKTVAARKRVILTGSVIIEEDGSYFNRMIWMLPDGNCGYYDKRHLFAYASEDRSYTAGKKRLIASVKGWKINLQVCYDLRFPVWVRQRSFPRQGDGMTTHNEYDLIVYVANWPERRNHAWKTLLQARAIENQCYVAGVNRVGNDGNGIYHSGDSMIVDPLGEVLYTQAHKEDVHTAILYKEKLEEVRTRFPFWKDADSFLIDP
ncbi:amidohydrolase [Agriterribacter sp.]|uniref:amidohydrolase n=1 Tax=Agriterribacter sp. TaxID=2821509 RepID=UPI002CEBB261|nr:amidohydrolase [Agriterribacter sp.]HRP56537.1 amidohydrolase [Agriterribacter sp.]